jgi:hypothetical protein
MVAAMMPKLELEGFAPKGLAQNLMPHADAKHGLLAQDGLGIFDCIGSCRRVTLHVAAQPYMSDAQRT